MKPYWMEKSFGVPAVKRKEETRDGATSNLTNPEGWLLQAILGRVASATGITVTPIRMMGIATTFACVRKLSTTMASLPLILYKGDGSGGRVPAYDHPLFSLMHDAPNDEMSIYDFISSVQGFLSLRQNGFAQIMRDSDGDVAGLYPIDPVDLTITRDPKSLDLVYNFMRGSKRFTPSQILHLRGYTRTGLVGVDHAINTQEVFALAIALQDNAAKFFGNGSRPGGVLEHPMTLSSEAQSRLREQIENSTGGTNAYRTMILEEGLKYTATRSENKDSQFQEARDYQDLQICRIFGVPPHKVGITANMPRANVEEENIGFVADTIRPECVNWEKKLNSRLLTDEERGQGYTFEFDLDALMRGNTTQRYTAYALGRNGGWLNANEIRRKERMNPIGQIGDLFLQPVNYVPLGTLPQAQPAPQEPGDKGGDPTKGIEAKPGEGAVPKPAPSPAKPAGPAPLAKAPADAAMDDTDIADRVIPPLQGKPKELAASSDITQITV